MINAAEDWDHLDASTQRRAIYDAVVAGGGDNVVSDDFMRRLTRHTEAAVAAMGRVQAAFETIAQSEETT